MVKAGLGLVERKALVERGTSGRVHDERESGKEAQVVITRTQHLEVMVSFDRYQSTGRVGRARSGMFSCERTSRRYRGRREILPDLRSWIRRFRRGSEGRSRPLRERRAGRPARTCRRLGGEWRKPVPSAASSLLGHGPPPNGFAQ